MTTEMGNAKMDNMGIVLVVGDRFFSGKRKNGRVQTAWSLAGAKMFGDWQSKEIEKAEKLLKSKGYKSERARVHMTGRIAS